MKQEEIKLHIAKEDISLVEAMQMIQRNADGVIFVVDGEGKLLGSVTDGDIRRWLIKTGDINASVMQVMFRHVRYIYESEKEIAKQFMIENKVLVVPVVTNDLQIQDIIINTDIRSWRKGSNVLKDTAIIIMAGGKGLRLRPYTKILPKPLIPIGDIPIIERIMRQLGDYGANNFYITLNYKKEMIKAYLKEQELPYEIHFIEESKPLGTAGSITLISEKFEQPVLITNCDILIETDYDDLMNFHKTSRNEMTIVASLRRTVIPYGVLYSAHDGRITSMEEKPRVSYLINTGMYIANPRIFDMIPPNELFHMPWLAQKAIDRKLKVGMYPIAESSFWDMGQFEELRKMEEKFGAKM